MKFIVAKSKIIVFGTFQNNNEPNYNLNGECLSVTESVKYLGVVINTKLK